MLDFSHIPEVEVGTCSLQCSPAGTASTPEEAWRLLPARGQGVVVLADRILDLESSAREGLIVEAEAFEPGCTTVLRMDGGVWRAWRWAESAGDSHRYVERRYRSSRPVAQGEPPHLVYRHYWTRVEDPGLEPPVAVWQPIGARLVGFEGGR